MLSIIFWAIVVCAIIWVIRVLGSNVHTGIKEIDRHLHD